MKKDLLALLFVILLVAVVINGTHLFQCYNQTLRQKRLS